MFFSKRRPDQNQVQQVLSSIQAAISEYLPGEWAWIPNLDYPCQVGKPEGCKESHPSLMIMPSKELLKDVYHSDSLTGKSELRPPNAAIFYAHTSKDTGFTEFYLHDVQAEGGGIANAFLGYKSYICNSSDANPAKRSAEKVGNHFASFLNERAIEEFHKKLS